LNNGTWCGDDLSWFQATGISNYDIEYKLSETHRDRCLPGTACALYKKMKGPTNETQRWLNIFRMNGHQAVEHGFSTGVRGGANNVPGFINCNGQYPCEARYEFFWDQCATRDGRFYQANIACVMCKAKKIGDRGGEFSYNPLQDGREWQEKAAMFGFLDAFGRKDSNGTTYMSVEDVRSMLIHGRYPEGWKKRPWGCMSGCDVGNFKEAIQYVLPCDDEAWWKNTGCETTVDEGSACMLYCNTANTTCVSGRCTCGYDEHGYAMCNQNNKCVPRNKLCSFQGTECEWLPADNPVGPN